MTNSHQQRMSPSEWFPMHCPSDQHGEMRRGTAFMPCRPGKRFWFGSCIHKPMGRPPGPTVLTRTRCTTASRARSCQFQRTAKGKEISPCPSQGIAHWGACGKAPVMAQNHQPRPRPAEMKERHAGAAVDVRGGCGDVGPAVGPAARSRALGAVMQRGTPPGWAERAGRAVGWKATRDANVPNKRFD